MIDRRSLGNFVLPVGRYCGVTSCLACDAIMTLVAVVIVLVVRTSLHLVVFQSNVYEVTCSAGSGVTSS